MSLPGDGGLGADLLDALTGFLEPEPRQGEPPARGPSPALQLSENEALQLEIGAWVQAQRRPAQLRPAAQRSSETSHPVAAPPVAASLSLSENEALQLEIGAWVQAQQRSIAQPRAALRRAGGDSDKVSHRVAEPSPPPVAASGRPKSASLDLLGDLGLGGGGRRDAPAASPANAMMERALQRRRRQRADAGRQLDQRSAAHPIDTTGPARGGAAGGATGGAAGAAPLTFTTSLHDKADGFYDVDLHVAGEAAVRKPLTLTLTPHPNPNPNPNPYPYPYPNLYPTPTPYPLTPTPYP